MKLVFNASPLNHFAKAGKLDVLASLTGGAECFVTTATLEELQNGMAKNPANAEVLGAKWMVRVALTSLAELAAFAAYARRLGSGERHVGEASTLAWAEIHSATAVVDETAGKAAGIERGVSVHGSLWLLANGLRAGLLVDREVIEIVDVLKNSRAWLPCSGKEFLDWARDRGLL